MTSPEELRNVKEEVVSQTSTEVEMYEDNDDIPSNLIYFIENGQFPNEWSYEERLPMSILDHLNVDTKKGKHEKLIDKVLKDSWFEEDIRERLKQAALDVIQGGLTRGVAAMTNEVDWTDLSAILTEVYERSHLDQFGDVHTNIPNFELQLMEIKLDQDELNREEEDLVPSSSKQVQAQDDTISEASTSTKKPKKRRSNTYSHLSKIVNGKKYARFGVLVPDHWKKYPDLVRAGIRKSLAMRVEKSSDRCHVVSDDIKFVAVEDVILNESSCKQNATKHNINYSTMQNYVHRAIFVNSIILGELDLPDQVKKLMAKNQTADQIANSFEIKRPISQVRVCFRSLQP